jgi:hypothetical protein
VTMSLGGYISRGEGIYLDEPSFASVLPKTNRGVTRI